MPDDLRTRLEAVNQAHLLHFIDELDAPAQARLRAQIESLDLEAIPTLIDRYVRTRPDHAPPSALEPAPYYPRDPDDAHRPWNRDGVRAAGLRLLQTGKVAAFTVAGGQGSRLSFDGPKGCYPAGAVSAKPLFQFFAEAIIKSSQTHGAELPWYIMTSPLNHDATVAFFDEHKHFGLDPALVTFFPQGVMPTFDRQSGRILLADRATVATNPDGHGGSLTALARSGALDDMIRREIEHVSYFQVDNPITYIFDPVFIGLHTTSKDTSAEMSSKMIPKRDPREKVGLFCKVDDRLQMIEYSDLPDELATKTDASANLVFNAGNPAIHMIAVEFIQKLTSDDDFQLPYHRADKIVEHVDLETGDMVRPDTPNGVKLEKFVFDALPLCRSSIVLETERVEEFAPIKNAEGSDSPATSAQLQTERAARWLESVGAIIPRHPDGTPHCTIELSPLTAIEPEQLRDADIPDIKPGDRVAI